jgi:hypothetical protein
VWYSPLKSAAPAKFKAVMTVDEELSLLENSIRQLKIEYDVYFGGG